LAGPAAAPADALVTRGGAQAKARGNLRQRRSLR